MLKALARRGRPAIVALTVTAAACGGLIASSATTAAAFGGGFGQFNDQPPAVTLSGDWAPFNRCPVDDPAMLAADGQTTVALCSAFGSPNGLVKIGNVTLPTGASNIQFGLLSVNEITPVSPRGGALVIAPITIPDGLPTLVCPTTGWAMRWICDPHGGGLHGDDHGLRDVTVTTESAGPVSNFNLEGAVQIGVPFASVPVKIHVQNPLLGPGCYIGSDSEPIVLQVEELTAVTSSGFEPFALDGTPLSSEEGGPVERIGVFGANDGDNSFAVPAASGCGFRGQLDTELNRNVGLPSPSGANSVVMNGVSGFIMGLSGPGAVVPNDGKDLSQYWHAAVEGGGGHGGGHHHHY